MESKKNIGKLFKENLEQLDYAPSNKVWEQIELDLEKKKKKRRFFFWFFFATTFMGLVVGGSYVFFNGNSSSKGGKETSSSIEKSTSNSLSSDSKETISSTEKAKDNSTITRNNTTKSTSKNSIADRNSNLTTKELHKGMNSAHKKSRSESKNNMQTTAFNSAQTDSKNKTAASRKKTTSKKESRVGSSSFSKNRLEKVQSNAQSTDQISDATPANDANQTLAQKGSPYEEFTKQTPIDSLITAAVQVDKVKRKNTKPNDSLPLEKTEQKTKEKEYEIVVAPYYGLNHGGYFGDFNALSKNRVLDEKIETSATYGVLLRWMFGDKLGIQTGVGKINNSYTATVEKTGTQFINTQTVATDQSISDLNTIFSNDTKVKFTYESYFLEVPFEAYYVIIDKKLGLATSFGVSMLFGNKNTVFAASETIQNIKIGTVSTISPTSATLNAKLNLFYKITPSLQFDLYPTFQYQIMGNTDSSDYSSYFLSVRTGLSYKF